MAIDPPYRFDPFQNLVNVSWDQQDKIQYFTYSAHNANGGIMTYRDDVLLGYTTGNPAKYPDQTPPAQTEYSNLVDKYMTNDFDRGFCVKSASDYNTKYGLPNVPVNVLSPGRLVTGGWSMSLDVEEIEPSTDDSGLPDGYVMPGLVNFSVKGFPLGEDWQVPIHWEGPGGTEANGGCHFAWCTASWTPEHRRKQLLDDWNTSDGEPGPAADVLTSFSIDFNISYTEGESTYDAYAMRIIRGTIYPGESYAWVTSEAALADPIWGFDYYGNKYDSQWNVIGLDTDIGFKHIGGAEQMVIVRFRKRTNTA